MIGRDIGHLAHQAVQALAQEPPARRSRAPNSRGHTGRGSVGGGVAKQRQRQPQQRWQQQQRGSAAAAARQRGSSTFLSGGSSSAAARQQHFSLVADSPEAVTGVLKDAIMHEA